MKMCSLWLCWTVTGDLEKSVVFERRGLLFGTVQEKYLIFWGRRLLIDKVVDVQQGVVFHGYKKV